MININDRFVHSTTRRTATGVGSIMLWQLPIYQILSGYTPAAFIEPQSFIVSYNQLHLFVYISARILHQGKVFAFNFSSPFQNNNAVDRMSELLDT